MSSIFHQSSLPVSQTQEEPKCPGIRRRLSSLSLNLKIPAPSSASKSVDYAGDSIRKWWHWGCAWILSRKPTFASDLEMNEEETAALGSHNRGSWRHVFFKVISNLRHKLLRTDDNVRLPQTFRYNKPGSRSASFIY